MNILVTGARGFVGRNLVESLKNIRDNKDRTRPELKIDNIFEYDIGTDSAELERFCKDTDFVFDFAGVNRPKDSSEFVTGNVGFTSELIGLLEKHNNTCPIVFRHQFRQLLQGGMQTVNTVNQSLRRKICSLTMQAERAHAYSYIAFRTFSVSGAALTITAS